MSLGCFCLIFWQTHYTLDTLNLLSTKTLLLNHVSPVPHLHYWFFLAQVLEVLNSNLLMKINPFRLSLLPKSVKIFHIPVSCLLGICWMLLETSSKSLIKILKKRATEKACGTVPEIFLKLTSILNSHPLGVAYKSTQLSTWPHLSMFSTRIHGRYLAESLTPPVYHIFMISQLSNHVKPRNWAPW